MFVLQNVQAKLHRLKTKTVIISLSKFHDMNCVKLFSKSSEAKINMKTVLPCRFYFFYVINT